MKYMLTMNEVDSDFAERTDPTRAGAYWGAWSAYSQAIQQAGIFVSGAGLQPPSTATTIRVRAGKTQVQDGPFADTKEQLAGFYVIDVPDLDAALAWAAKAPSAATASVEVRPLLPPPAA
jgi:hypothetical protein